MPNQSAFTPAPDPRTAWNDLFHSYRQCAAIARQIWGEDYEPAALVASAATLFIQAAKQGLRPAPSAKQRAESSPPPTGGTRPDREDFNRPPRRGGPYPNPNQRRA
jgi:hypothetical protein